MSRDRPQTLSDLVRQCAAKFGDRPAVASREGLRTHTLTYRALEEAAGSVAGELTSRFGLGKGQRALLMAPPGARTVAVLFGLFRAGIVAVPLDRSTTQSSLEAIWRKTDAAAMICPREIPVPDSLAKIAIEDLALAGMSAPAMQEPVPEDIAEIVFTSGTTGDPKGVVLTHRNILSDVTGAAAVVPQGEEMNLVSILPLSHMFEQTVGLFLPMQNGGMVHYAPSLKPSAIVAEIRRRRATGMVVVPRFLELLITAAEETARARGLGQIWDIQNRISARLPMALRRFVFFPFHRHLGGRLRFFLSGGAALSPELMLAWERTGVRIIEGYGATECAPVVSSNAFHDRAPGGIGRPLEGVSVRLSDERELQVRGPNVFGGYWQDPELTQETFTPDGWYKTGDVAESTADGQLRIVGRLAERIVLPSGMNLYPLDVESELDRQPEIGESVVIGVALERGGESPHAVIRPADGCGEADVARALERAGKSLASHQRITGFTIWNEDFPKTALQKVKRREVRKAIEDRSAGVVKLPAAEPGDLAARLLRRVSRVAPSSLTPEMRLDADVGLDSLGRVELAGLIETETGRDVQEEVIAELATVGDLSDFLAGPVQRATDTPLAGWPRSPAASFLRRFLLPLVLFLPYSLFARPFRVTGHQEFAAANGPFLVIANHASHTDTLAILKALPSSIRGRIAVAAAADYFFANRWAAVFAALLLNAFPFSREGRVRASLDACGQLADEGWSILIYPEGTRSPDGRLLPFKMGIGLLATGLNVPAIPAAVTGGAKLLRKGSLWPKRTAVSVHFGTPVTIEPEMSPEETTALLQRCVAKLLDEANNCEEEQRVHG